MSEDTELPSAESLLADTESPVTEASTASAGEPLHEALQRAPTEDRKALLRALRDRAETEPDSVAPLLAELAPVLTDEERSVRLSTAKLFAAVADDAPAAVADHVPLLADRLGDADEFYYVRARAAEALGYVGLERPAAVDDPEILAELTVGLAFEDVEVRRKLAGALTGLALGDPARLANRATSMAEHLEDDDERVRFRLMSALAAVACERPDAVARAVADRGALAGVLEDPSPWVLGRAVETVGLLARDGGSPPTVDATALPDATELAERTDEDDARRFAEVRLGFAAERLGASLAQPDPDAASEVGTLEGIETSTAAAIESMTAPADACPHCGLGRPPEGPPICPGCGGPF